MATPPPNPSNSSNSAGASTPARTPPRDDAAEARHVAKHSAKETVISIIIAFTLAFVFRGFVVEAYVIPTGSMAPTLMGQHVRLTGDTGYQWPMGPAEYASGNLQIPLALQGRRDNPLVARDPMTGPARESAFERQRGRSALSSRGVFDREVVNAPIRGGDRIFVMKYLASVYEPARWDVCVFKNPRQPTENYIKRLIGLPGEQIAFVDGDLFVRRAPASTQPGPSTPAGEPSPWLDTGWTIARKNAPGLSPRVEHALWQLVHDSAYIPADPVRDGRRWSAPWLPNGIRTVAKDWTLLGEGARRGLYTYTGAAPTSLVWDAEAWPITDSYPYNDQSRAQGVIRPRANGEFPVHDLAIRFAIIPDPPAAANAAPAPSSSRRAAGIITSRGHEFLGEIDLASDGTSVARLKMRPLLPGASPVAANAPGAVASTAEWTTLATEPLPAGALAPGVPTRFEFCHVDQSLEVLVNDSRVAFATYDWSPADRLRFATGRTVEDVDNAGDLGVLSLGSAYSPVGVRLELSGGPATLSNVAILRDVFYRPDLHPSGTRMGLPGAGTHPRFTLTLGPDQFFVCGDNSPDSLDGRLWGDPDPWTAAIDPAPSVVHRSLLIGKAFFVYFPAAHRWFNYVVPDFGRMRWIF
jgi:signal peptidase I